MRDTTVEVSKLTQNGNRFYRGGQHVVTSAVAEELVKSGNAKILDGTKPKAKAKDEGDK